MENKKYILITAARNEEVLIEKTIKSVICQTYKPMKWVIVSDGSTDRTDDIVNSYAKEYNWIELMRMPPHRVRSFSAHVTCFNAAFEKVKDLPFDIIGNLDADISFEDDNDYYAFLINKFAEYPDLGVAGTPFFEGSSHYDFRFSNIEHVSGGCQLFRRECLPNGYTQLNGGGYDTIAVTTARMNGWKTRTFTEKKCYHHRPMGTGGNSFIKASYILGREDYYLGGHPLWEVFRAFYQMTKSPIGGLAILCGYSVSFLKRIERPVSRDFIKFHRGEQMHRFKKKLKLV